MRLAHHIAPTVLFQVGTRKEQPVAVDKYGAELPVKHLI